MQFTKMHGAGNDYVYVDCFAQPVPRDIPELARRISDRRFGVGGDGLILICPSERADAEMRMYNADGSYGEMCGNGIRCVAKYVYDHGIRRQRDAENRIGRARAIARSVLHRRQSQQVRGRYGRADIDSGTDSDDTSLRRRGGAGRRRCARFDRRARVYASRAFRWAIRIAWCLSMNRRMIGCLESGRRSKSIRIFRNESMLSLSKVLSRDASCEQRTWERGSGETLACGTGACAVCVAGVLTGRTRSEGADSSARRRFVD